ncbi:hypothetical protein BBP40_002332 [Aspergillus hancockii]|nr:hypothetical protein BBP40_002332 [Aspergillus hancockii]
MHSFTSLPVEILHRVVHFADCGSLKELRLTCRSLSDIGKGRLFESITVFAEEEKSSDNFEKFLEDSSRAQLVAKVTFDLSKWEGDFDEDALDDTGEDSDLFTNQVKMRKFIKLFGRLRELPRLRSVVLRFHPDCCVDDVWKDVPQSVELRSLIMKHFMASLASLPRPTQELAIRDLQNVNETDPEVVENITKVLGNLRALRLNITNEHDEGNGEHDLEQAEPHIFFPELSSFWLKPALSNLQHLTLYSSNYWGYYPKCDFQGIHFPQLKTIGLGNYAFVHDSQLDWILSHSSTLTELYLDDCPILFEVAIYNKEKTLLDPETYTSSPGLGDANWASYDKRWHHYFKAFQNDLPHLRHFRYGHSQHWWDDDTTPFEREGDITMGIHDESYMVFCDGYGPSPYMKRMIRTQGEGRDVEWVNETVLPWIEEDQTSLEELLAKIGMDHVMDEESENQIDRARWERTPRE